MEEYSTADTLACHVQIPGADPTAHGMLQLAGYVVSSLQSAVLARMMMAATGKDPGTMAAHAIALPVG